MHGFLAPLSWKAENGSPRLPRLLPVFVLVVALVCAGLTPLRARGASNPDSALAEGRAVVHSLVLAAASPAGAPHSSGAAAGPERKPDASASAPADVAPADAAPASSQPAPSSPQTAPAAPAAQASPAAQAAPPIRLFGTVEFRSPIKNLPKWERVRNSEASNPSFAANGLSTSNEKVAQRWAKIKAENQGAPLREKMKNVNNFFNQWPYKTDMENWGVEDYWATPREFVQKSGDCEDYAITKYYALRDLGVPAASMRVAAVQDTIRGLGHAILIVFVDNDAYILDNLTNLVLSHKRLSHYTLMFTVNEEFLWRHVKPKNTPGNG